MSELAREELARLGRFLQAHDSRFALALIRIPGLADRDLLAAWVAAFAQDHTRQVRRIEGTGLAPLQLWDKLAEPAQPGTVVLLDGLDQAFRAENGEVLSILNRQRERLAQALPGPVLLLLGDSALDRFLASAPDLADWHAATFDFRPEAQRLEPLVIEPDAAPELSRELVDARIKLLNAQFEDGVINDEQRWRMAGELANLYKHQGRYAEACHFAGLSEEEAVRLYGENHPTTINVRLLRASCLKENGDHSAARTIAESVLDARVRLNGPDDASVANAHGHLAAVLVALEEHRQARQHLEAALESEIRRLGPDHETIGILRSNLGLTLDELGEHEEAVQQAQLSLKIALSNLGPDSSLVAACRSNLAISLFHLLRYEEAGLHFESALESDLRRFGPEHPIVGTRRQNLACVYASLGDPRRARQELELALGIFRATLPPEHPDIRRVSGLVAQLNSAERNSAPRDP